jgi:5-methylcytosine-specific restriction endonuclease McrA
MSYLKDVKRELKETPNLDKLTKGNVDALEAAYIRDNPKCYKCGNTKNLTYDHIIPQFVLQCFNVDARKEFWEENSQTLCFACNHMKGALLDLSNPKTKPLLQELLNK